MRILHVIHPTSYLVTRDYIRFLREYFKAENHSATVIGRTAKISESTVPRDIPEVKYFNSYLANLFGIERHFSKFDTLFHAISMPEIIKALRAG